MPFPSASTASVWSRRLALAVVTVFESSVVSSPAYSQTVRVVDPSTACVRWSISLWSQALSAAKSDLVVVVRPSALTTISVLLICTALSELTMIVRVATPVVLFTTVTSLSRRSMSPSQSASTVVVRLSPSGVVTSIVFDTIVPSAFLTHVVASRFCEPDNTFTSRTSSLASNVPFWFRSTHSCRVTLSAPRKVFVIPKIESSAFFAVTVVVRLPEASITTTSVTLRSTPPVPSKSSFCVVVRPSAETELVVEDRVVPSPFFTSTTVEVPTPESSVTVSTSCRSVSPSPSRSVVTVRVRPSALMTSVSVLRTVPSLFLTVTTSVRTPAASVVITVVVIRSAPPAFTLPSPSMFS